MLRKDDSVICVLRWPMVNPFKDNVDIQGILHMHIRMHTTRYRKDEGSAVVAGAKACRMLMLPPF
jgi:hypothetical protein